ncbi:hypothetical protein NP493_123g00001 [Ridgeia piscesae]|uniref:Bcl-2 Bcl-2 homology region 1-3 domain-containing protein n=1 Tax=Ridgeia piscesae TaxID=27915 RepID=A0AAD9P5W4_RIDPI|nr:hypothetical protein NP493_123g00001 [Ridgeia piscesae]
MWLCKDVSEMPCFTRTTNAAMCWTKIHSVCLYPGLAMKFAIASHRGSPAARIGRQLAMIGDDINDRYSPQFNQMIRTLNITPDTAYEAFAGVARKLFRDGNINWGRIITLLCFGYRMAVTVIQRGIRGFFSNIVGFVVKFIMTEKIAKWIAEQGGWRAVLLYVPETVGWPTICMILSIAAISIMSALFFSRK